VINNAPSLVTTQPALASGVRQSMALRSTVADYWALTKPEVNLLIGIAAGAGFHLALRRLHDFQLPRLFSTVWYAAGRERYRRPESV
jgi:heme O synthase-like polyprenyltransferase